MLAFEDRPFFYENPLRFRGYSGSSPGQPETPACGYFTRPIDLATPIPRTLVQRERWLRLQDAVFRAMRGDFSVGPVVLGLYRESFADHSEHREWEFFHTAVTILGHVGTVDCFRDMRRELETPPIRNVGYQDLDAREMIKHYCKAFVSWGRLDALPVILDQYLHQRQNDVPELNLFPCYMADMLLPSLAGTMMVYEPPEHMLEDYLNLVMDRYDELVAELGSDKIHVAFGEALSPRRLAERICAGGDRFDLGFLRERFEPMTGIDCTDFFTPEPWTPLAAAVIAEDFLASEASHRYEPGARYFFGHRIPDDAP